jgi:glycosyltransferase involved in cell wall biosynthesis
MHLLPNGFDAAAVGRLAPAAKGAEVAFAGRLIAPKQVDLLLRAVQRLDRAGQPVRCVVVGDGPERDRLAALARSLEVDGLVRFAGALPTHDEVLAVLAAATVFVLPSVREGFGMVVLEANACGLPVITVDHPGNAAVELIADGDNGWVVPGTVEALAEAIRRAVSDPPATISADRIARGVRAYAWPALAERYALAALYSPGTPAGAIPVPHARTKESPCSPSSS